MTFKAQHDGAWGDIQWHTTTHPEYPEFYVSPSTRRTVQTLRPAGSFFPGQLYCGFGRATNGNACADVQYGEFNCGSKGRQVIMSVDGQVGALGNGDSGGPWYISNTAAGIFMGWCTFGGIAHLSFTKMDYSDDALGVTVLLAP